MPISDAGILRIVYGLLLGMEALDWVRRNPLPPGRMASHFGPHGEVNGWQSKEQFFMAVVVGVSFVAGFVVPLLIGIMPASITTIEKKMKEAIAFHLAGLREEGQAIPEPHTFSTNIDLPAEKF
jgi:hypothetical protein